MQLTLSLRTPRCFRHLTEGDIGICGVAVSQSFFWCGVAVNKIICCGVAVISNCAVCGVSDFKPTVFGETKLFADPLLCCGLL